MSVLHRDLVKGTAEAMGIDKLKEEVAGALTQDVEYRLREVIQEAKKFMRHSRRNFLSTNDINSALKVKNVEPLYGFVAPRHVKFKKTDSSVYYMEDEELDFDKILSTPLPKMPLEVGFSAHWLAIDGVQPAIPQNPPPNYGEKNPGLAPSSQLNLGETGNVGHPLVKDVLSKELQLYFEKITDVIFDGTDEAREIGLSSVASDPGLQSLLPYFIKHAQDKVTKNIRNLKLLAIVVSFLDHLLRNPNFFMEPYLHQLLPVLLTTIVGKQLCADPATEDHWALRQYAARLLSSILKRYAEQYPTLLPRVTKTLLIALVDETKPLTTKYGAVAALSKLGPEVIRVCLLPNAKTCATTIFEVFKDDQQADPMDVDNEPPADGAKIPPEGTANVSPSKQAGYKAPLKATLVEMKHLLDVYADAIATIIRLDEASDRKTRPDQVASEEPGAKEEKIVSDFGNVLGPAIIDRLKAS